jgi:hypothetical protein
VATEKLDDSRQYKVPLSIQAAAPALLVVLTFLIKESPFWLLKKGQEEEARTVLAPLRNDNPMLVEAELSATHIDLPPREERNSEVKAIKTLKPTHLK